MNENELKEIIANGENSGVEFKEARIENENLAKEIAAFSNLEGGLILFGVADDGKIKGIADENLGDWVMDVCSGGSIEPPVTPFIENVPVDGKTVCAVRIHQGYNKPYRVKKDRPGDTRRTYYIRAFKSVREASPEELRRMYQASGFVHYDITPVSGATPEDLEMDSIEQYFNMYRSFNLSGLGKDEKETAAKTTILINADILRRAENGTVVPSTAGMLFFGKEPAKYLPQAGITFAHFDGKDVTDNILDRKTFNKSVLDNLNDVIAAIRVNVPVKSTISGLKREDEIIFPETALREAVVNAFSHRDYTIHGAKIMVFLFNDRLVIKSPGIPPNSVTIESMKIGCAVHRNPLIVKLFSDFKLVEGLGRGVPLIFDEMKKHSGKEPEIRIEGQETILTLYRKGTSA